MMLAITLIAFCLNMLILVPPTSGPEAIAQNQVLSISVYHNDKPYILNFKQQQQLVQLINEGKIIPKPVQTDKLEDQGVQQISIRLFKKSPVVVTPLGIVNSRWVFLVKEDSKEYFLEEKEIGTFAQLLKGTYDHN
jgi:hypothetical protein